MGQATILNLLLAAADRNERPNLGVSGMMQYRKSDVLVVGIDNGNDALKGAVLTPNGELVTVRIPTAYRLAERVQGGDQDVSYTIAGTTFWIGAAALKHEGDGLPIGPTPQRLTDPRQRKFIAAGIVELLHEAGFLPGTYSIILGFAIPNNEIVPLRGEDGQDKLGVNDQTRAILIEHIKGATWEVERTNEVGKTSTWTIKVVSPVPQAQTAGTVLVSTKTPQGKTVTEFEGMKIIDIGGGDLQVTDCTIQPSYQMISRREGDGTIRIARELKAMFPRYELNDVAAQHALVTRRLMVAGRMRDISQQVDESLNGKGQSIIADVLPVLHQSSRFVLITGGGVILLHDLLEERLAKEDKKRGEDYELINHGISSLLNAVGALIGAILTLKGKS